MLSKLPKITAPGLIRASSLAAKILIDTSGSLACWKSHFDSTVDQKEITQMSSLLAPMKPSGSGFVIAHVDDLFKTPRAGMTKLSTTLESILPHMQIYDFLDFEVRETFVGWQKRSPIRFNGAMILAGMIDRIASALNTLLQEHGEGIALQYASPTLTWQPKGSNFAYRNDSRVFNFHTDTLWFGMLMVLQGEGTIVKHKRNEYRISPMHVLLFTEERRTNAFRSRSVSVPSTVHKAPKTDRPRLLVDARFVGRLAQS